MRSGVRDPLRSLTALACVAREPQDAGAQWSKSASVYAALTQRYEVFRQLADRLVGALPPDFSGAVADIGSGTGMLSAQILAHRPRAHVLAIEPARAMSEIARRELDRYGARVRFLECTLEEATGIEVDAALSSLAMSFVDPASGFDAIARALSPGGLFAFNRWGNAYGTNGDAFQDVRAVLERVLVEHGRDAQLPAGRARRLGMRAIEGHARSAGLVPDRITLDVDRAPLALLVEMAAASTACFAELGASALERALELAREPIELESVRVTFRRA